MIASLQQLANRIWPSRKRRLSANTAPVRSLRHLKLALGWTEDPILEGDHLHECNNLTDINERRLRDAEVIGAACANNLPQVLLEIGTSEGRGTALMAANAPHGTVHTVNIPPEEIDSGGRFITHAPTRDEIGWYYRQQGHKNVRQILANTATWEPDLGLIDVAFIDGCHDADFVFNDTRKILPHMRPGGVVLWHDFAPELAAVHPWIADVCEGVDQLYRERFLVGPTLHLVDSWVGLYRVPGDA